MSPKVMNCPHCGRILPGEFWHEQDSVAKIPVKCPRCGSFKNWKNAKRYTPSEVIQCYLCRDCGHRFSKR
jgi:transposase-like protein